MPRRLLLATALLLCLALAALAQAEQIQRGDLRVTFSAGLTPRRLPRSGSAPVRVSLGGRFATVDGRLPPQLRTISIAINGHGRLSPTGLPSCPLSEIQPSTTAGALAACRRSLIGEGHFSAKVLFPSESPFPSSGKVYAFNGRFHGHPAILAHIYGTVPAPTSSTIPFTISPDRGTYGTLLRASLPHVTSKWGYVTGLDLTLGRGYRSHGRARSYLSAACPAPPGIARVAFPLARATYGFADGRSISSTLTRTCRVRGH
jgi:hypothetical protein